MRHLQRHIAASKASPPVFNSTVERKRPTPAWPVTPRNHGPRCRVGVGFAKARVTGLSRPELEQLAHFRCRAGSREKRRSKPFGSASANQIAVLAIDVRWMRVKPDIFTVQVRVDLMEAARLIKDPSQVVWTSSWRNVYTSVASSPNDLPSVVRSVTRGQVETFARLYQRAHAK